MARGKSSGIKPADAFKFKSVPKSTRVLGSRKTDLSRYVKWPKYVRIQRQRKILWQRLKVPPALNQFTLTANSNLQTKLFKLFNKYKPETKKERKERRTQAAAAEAASGKAAAPAKTGPVIQFGLNKVTTLIENKKAKLVLIANDVDPIEMVVWLPALCRMQGVPYAIVKTKAKLGELVHMKTASCVALTQVRQEDEHTLKDLSEHVMSDFNNNTDVLRKWHTGVMGLKTQKRLEKRAAALELEKKKQAKAKGL